MKSKASNLAQKLYISTHYAIIFIALFKYNLNSLYQAFKSPLQLLFSNTLSMEHSGI